MMISSKDETKGDREQEEDLSKLWKTSKTSKIEKPVKRKLKKTQEIIFVSDFDKMINI